MDKSNGSNCRPLRKGGRQLLEYETTLKAVDGPKSRFTIRNISQCGFMGDSGDVHAVGAQVILYLPVIGQVDAMVKWSSGNRIGCQLTSALTFQQVFLVLMLAETASLEREREADSASDRKAA